MTYHFQNAIDTGGIETIGSVDEAKIRLDAVRQAFAYEDFSVLDILYIDGKPSARVLLDSATPERPLHLKTFDRDERRVLFSLIAQSSAPVRWRSRRSPPVAPIVASPHLFREQQETYESPGGLYVPVHSGLNRAGVVIFFGDGKPDLCLGEIGSLRLFCVCWFARLSQLGLGHSTPVTLTRRELECLQLAATGLTAEGIAEALDLSRHTVTHHLVSATSKLGASNRTHAIAEAVRRGLLR
ncbi:MAG: helix-turn-helix transcriptional regulator [Rhizobiaceae bacterium]|nr:helix-turn-helix transcriptional regulator [Rhizobiaceae bacterium]